MSIIIPLNTTVSNFSQEIVLEGVPYRFDFVWNTRSLKWSMSISNIDLTGIVSGIVLVLNYDLFEQFTGSTLPPGALYCIDVTEKAEKITRDNLGDIIKLVYLEEDELATV